MMDIVDRITDIGAGLPPRGIPAVHECREQAAPARAARDARVDRVCLADPECRNRLRAAVMEISRLQRGILTAGERAQLEPPPRRAEDVPPDPKASPPAERKAYAPDPPGRPPEIKDPTPPDPAELVRVVNWFHVTNMWTLLDVLA
ncbi:MAG: hypothetical protein ACYSWT_06705 [Planctomycetota bacterium]|jgi:hypothetical protein